MEFGIFSNGDRSNRLAANSYDEDDSTANRRARAREAMDLILRCWTEPEPFDFEGQYYHGKRINIQPKPFQKPFPPIGVASNSGNPEPMQLASRAEVRACRYVYVTNSNKRARDEMRPFITPNIELEKREYPQHFQHNMPPSDKVEDINYDYLVDVGQLIIGDPDHVFGLIKDFYDESGGFGTLLLIYGKDRGTREQKQRSMKLFMQAVAPRLRELEPAARPRLSAEPGA